MPRGSGGGVQGHGEKPGAGVQGRSGLGWVGFRVVRTWVLGGFFGGFGWVLGGFGWVWGGALCLFCWISRFLHGLCFGCRKFSSFLGERRVMCCATGVPPPVGPFSWVFTKTSGPKGWVYPPKSEGGVQKMVGFLQFPLVHVLWRLCLAFSRGCFPFKSGFSASGEWHSRFFETLLPIKVTQKW